MKHEDQVFSDTVVQLDGNEYERCTFSNVRLQFSGNAATLLSDCNFPPPNRNLELQLGEFAGKVVWNLGVDYRFGDRVAAEAAMRFVEGTAPINPSRGSAAPRAHTLELLRALHAAIPALVLQIRLFVRAEPQTALHEPVRLLCPNPSCGRVSFVPSMLPPGARRSVALHNAMTCPGCHTMARVEDHGTDDTGRPWREFADRILSQRSVTRQHLKDLHRVVTKAPSIDTVKTLSTIEAITPAFEPLVQEAKKNIDRRTFLRNMSILGTLAAAAMLGFDADNQDSSFASVVTGALHPPEASIGPRRLTDSDVLTQIENDLLEHCRRFADDPDSSLEDLQRALSACTAIGHEREQRMHKAAAESKGYARELLQKLVAAESVSPALLTVLAALLAAAVAKRLGISLEGLNADENKPKSADPPPSV